MEPGGCVGPHRVRPTPRKSMSYRDKSAYRGRVKRTLAYPALRNSFVTFIMSACVAPCGKTTVMAVDVFAPARLTALPKSFSTATRPLTETLPSENIETCSAEGPPRPLVLHPCPPKRAATTTKTVNRFIVPALYDTAPRPATASPCLAVILIMALLQAVLSPACPDASRGACRGISRSSKTLEIPRLRSE